MQNRLNNNYDTNETTNPTSTKPKKDVFSPSDDKVSIDGNEVKAGQELLYQTGMKIRSAFQTNNEMQTEEERQDAIDFFLFLW